MSLLQRISTPALTKRPTPFQRNMPYTPLVSARMVGSSKTRRGDSGAVYSFVAPLETNTGSSTSRRNLWKVCRDDDPKRELVAKGPSKDDNRAQGWPAFQHEVKMQRLFKEDKLIRPMIDFLPNSDVDNDEPMMVLNPFEQTLWDARHRRPMTTAEIKWIMEGVMLGLQTIHRRGLVHTGLFSNYMSSTSAAMDMRADLEQISRWRMWVSLASTTKSLTSIRGR